MSESPLYERRIEVDITPDEKSGGLKAATAIKDPVHGMQLLADIDDGGVLRNVQTPPQCYPFAACRLGIINSGRYAWEGISLHDKQAIRAGQKGMGGCEHIAELAYFLAFAYAQKVRALRLELHATLGDSPWHVVAEARSDGHMAGQLGIEMPVIGKGFGIRPCDVRITRTDVKSLMGKSPREAHSLVRENGNSSEETWTRLLLLFFRQTQRAILATHGRSMATIRPEGIRDRLGYHIFRSAVRLGKASPIGCIVFKDLVKKPDKALINRF